MPLPATPLLLFIVGAACLVPSVIAATAYDYGFDTGPLIRRQVSENGNNPRNRIVAKGVRRSNESKSVPLRQEIREFQEDGDQWTLFILGLSLMQFDDQDEPISFYQIAGIHGVPFVEWNGVQATPGNELAGYCLHENTLFPTWHRPYLALYEQILHNHIQQIASWYKDASTRKRYQRAAANFRIPYWDWAATPPEGESLLPLVVSGSPVVEVAGPNGVQNISNPLYAYEFRPLDASAFYIAPWDHWDRTLRSPSSQDSEATSNNTKVGLALDQNREVLQQRVYTILSSYDNYTTFSNEAWFPKGDSRHDSIESVHDAIHSIAGLGGHMTYIPFSSFDPIFWLHHTNLDRLFALWQVVHPDVWIEPQPASMASYTTSAGEIMTSRTLLAPFFADVNGTFWTSDTVRDPEVFQYNYKETSGARFTGKPQTEDETAAQIRVISTINRLYGQSSPARLAYSPSSMHRSKNFKAQIGNTFTDAEATAPLSSSILYRGRSYRDWTINVHVEKQELGTTYFVHIFNGSPPAAADSWISAPNLIGTLSMFASPNSIGMGAGAGANKINLVSGAIPLTAHLAGKVADGELTSLEVDQVEPYLKRLLQLRLVLADGTIVDRSAVSSLHISLVSSEVMAPETEFELPKWGESVQHFDIC
ncbi:uncharacterized protein PgNI_03926 [Pyricularia grisea]|uniref:tyrosinase n=1 Tax=Pyricularia grisea TaxID=148305 RepID=A0A6P8BBR4_PYRGI|nr:uncharacterized protein PgNI_03926 [Pyricularia grisea]TLD13239.1 hypothetical protein PgNI_03926 [Pyricularia grisea]